MTHQQGLSFALVGVTVILFVWGRWRYDLIALGALAAGLIIGVIPLKNAFAGLSNDIVIIIASALVLSSAVARSGIIDSLMAPLMPKLKSEKSQVPVLAGSVAVLSMVTKNVGALALMMPSALQISRRTGVSPGRLLMPMSFASLIGGLAVLVGTSPNIIVSGVREEALGEPFRMFDFMPVGGILTVLVLIYLTFAYRILPSTRRAAVNLDAALAANAYVTEVEAPEGWSFAASRIGDLIHAGDGAVRVIALLRGRARTNAPHANRKVQAGDTLLLEGEEQALNEFIQRTRLRLTHADRPIVMDEPTDEVRVVEAVISPSSDVIGKTAKSLVLHQTYGVNLLGVSRSGRRMAGGLSTTRLKAGDILVLQGSERSIPEALQALGCLPLAEREVRLGGIRHAIAPVAILAAAMALVAFGVLEVAAAFFIAAVAVVACGAMRMREAYAALDAPVLILVAALIPVSETVQASGGTELIASALSGAFHGLPPLLTLTLMMLVAMLATPFLNNAATVLIVAPIGMSLAQQLGYSPDPFLMAVAIGAGCDFLTPIGHQCNTLVLGPAGYKFSDYARLGAPLSLLILAVAPSLIALFWPFT
jgi:di/tricarboxylate transporter